MEVIIKGSAKEIAALAVEVQERQIEKLVSTPEAKKGSDDGALGRRLGVYPELGQEYWLEVKEC